LTVATLIRAEVHDENRAGELPDDGAALLSSAFRNHAVSFSTLDLSM
jgi:hypothetical protein